MTSPRSGVTLICNNPSPNYYFVEPQIEFLLKPESHLTSFFKVQTGRNLIIDFHRLHSGGFRSLTGPNCTIKHCPETKHAQREDFKGTFHPETDLLNPMLNRLKQTEIVLHRLPTAPRSQIDLKMLFKSLDVQFRRHAC